MELLKVRNRKVDIKAVLFIFSAWAMLVSNCLHAEEVVINQPMLISETDTSYDNKSVIVDGVEVTINGAHRFENLKITNNAVLTHNPGSRMELTIDNSLEIISSKIDVNGKGSLPSDLTGLYSGGSHGGIGGGDSASAYDDYKEPDMAGLGGRSGSLFITEENSTRGGGVVKIKVSTLFLDNASISADGATKWESDIGGGAGGTISFEFDAIEVPSYSGISASGNYGGGIGHEIDGQYFSPGDGAGGRVSLIYNNADQDSDFGKDYNFNNIQIYARGEINHNPGSAGTIFIKTNQKSYLYIYEPYYYSTQYTPINNVSSDTTLYVGYTHATVYNDILDFSISNDGMSGVRFANSIVVNKELRTESDWGCDAYNLSFMQDVVFNTPLPCGNIEVFGNLSVPDNDLVVDGFTLSLKGAQTFDSVHIKNGSRIISFPAESISAEPLTIVANDIILNDGAQIDLSNNGAMGIGQWNQVGGASHGGRGLSKPSDDIYSIDTYGEYDAPVTSGTGRYDGYRGGGALKLVATNLTLNGQIRSDSDSGSGGSIWIDADNIFSESSEAYISANGRSEDSGGGRIAVYYNQLNGINLHQKTSAGGYSPGTIYLKQDSGNGELIIENDNEEQPLEASSVFLKNDNDTLQANYANIVLHNIQSMSAGWNFTNSIVTIADSVDFTQFPQVDNTLLKFQEDSVLPETINIPTNSNLEFLKDLTLSGAIQGVDGKPSLKVNGAINVPGEELIVDGYTLEFGSSQTLDVVNIVNGGVITVARPADENSEVVNLTASVIRIDPISKIDVSGKGLKPGDAGGPYDGGSHGGSGGDSRYYWDGYTPPAPIYGNAISPISFGRGAKLSEPSFGGGAIKLTTDLLELGGSIVADGQSADEVGGGSAAGGSIWLNVGFFKFTSGLAKVTANGSDGRAVAFRGQHHAGGGGGRIALWYDSWEDVSFTNITTKGGRQVNSQYAQSGAPGTVYLHHKNNEDERLLIIGGTGVGSDYAKANVLSVPDSISIILDNADIAFPDDLSLKHINIKSSRASFGESFTVTDSITVDKSDVSFYGQANLDGDLAIKNQSRFSFDDQVVIHGDTLINHSQIDFYENAVLNTLEMNEGNASFNGDLTLTGIANLINSYVDINSNLFANEKVNFNSLVDNVFINAYLLDNGYVGVSGDLITLDANASEEAKSAIRFKVVRGLADGYGISFESRSTPGSYLQVEGQRLELAVNDQTENFAKAATFYIRKGNASSSYASFESMANPETFIRHKNGELWVEPVSNWLSRQESTWMVQSLNFTNIYLTEPTSITIKNNAHFGKGFEGSGPVSPKVIVGKDLVLPNNDLLVSGVSVSLAQHHTFNDIALNNFSEITIPDAKQFGRVNKGLNLVAKDVAVDTSSRINLSEKEQDFSSAITKVGGSHGGKGGNNGTSVSSPIYGNAEQPESVGLSGYSNLSNKSFGGSAFKLTAESLNLNGAILANGQKATADIAGAAGGSIWLIVNSITSSNQTGLIKADGGSALGVTNSAGGGGRIALYYQSIDGIDDANITVNGGAAGIAPSEAGGSGSIYRKMAAVPPYVVSINSTPLTNQSIEHLIVKFSAPIDIATLTSANMMLVDETQQSILINNVVEITETEFQLFFSPILSNGSYILTLSENIQGKNGLKLDQNKNLIPGEANDSFSNNFVVDTTPPAVPILNTYPEVTTLAVQPFGGTKEANTKVRLNGAVVVNANSQTTWNHNANLIPGLNHLEYTLQDQAGNISEPAFVDIIFDNTPPGPVSINVNPNGDGRQIYLNWSQYDNLANGNDIASFKVFASTNNYTTVSQLTPVRTLSANTKAVTLDNLVRGQTYYLSVVAYDKAGLFTNTVNAIAVAPIDTKAPSGISNLLVNPGVDFLQLSWNKADNTDGDLAYYRISYNDQGQPKSINLDQAGLGNTNPIIYQLTGLVPASAHNILVFAVDTSGNTSAALNNPGITLLSNPAVVTADAFSGSADISWSAATPHTLIKHYAVYVALQPFNSVEGMMPVKSVSKGSSSLSTIKTTLTGLTNGVKIYVAVTTVNNSNGEYKAVTPIEVTPLDDNEGPVVTEAKFTQGASALDLGASPVLTASGKITLKATDKSKVSRVVLKLNNNPLANLIITNPQGAYEYALDLNTLADGEYTLEVDAYDMLENLTHQVYNFSIDLAAPNAPSILVPAAGVVANQKLVTVSGKAAVGTQVALSNNGSVVVESASVDSNGNYSTQIELVEGDNNLTAKAKYSNRAKWSAESPVRKVVLNTQVPDAPAGFTATAIKQGQVNLSWSAVISNNANNQVKGYNLYRSASQFAQTSEPGVVKLNNALVSITSYNDVVLQDGAYYYAVSAVNQANNESALSAAVKAVVDGTGPKMVTIDYTTDGEFDAAGQRFGKGNVTVSARFSEALRNAPYFAIVPQNGLPVSIELNKDYSDELLYTGTFVVNEAVLSGTAYTVMSAHDNIGNRGTDILAGNSLLIDTRGPEINDLVLTPADPLKVDEANGLEVTVAITLNDAIKQGTQPRVVPMLDDTPVAGYEQGIQWIEVDGATYRGSFHLPNTAAQTASATLSFAHLAQDDLNNTATRIHGQNQFQVYQGELPPLNSPSGLSATALPSGKIKLQWNAVEKAVNYVLYRQGPGDSSLEILETLNTLEYEDQTQQDGTYLYAIASVRQDNGEQSESAKSDTVVVKADRVAPLPPQSLTLELNGTGIVSRWLAPVQDTEGSPQELIGLTYNVYRLDLPQDAQVSSLEGLTPIQTRIPALIALDTQPSEIEHSYFVTAVDTAGNESAPGITAYLNAGLLPVNQLDILLENNGYPQLTWKHKGTGIEGYRVYRYLGEGELSLLTPELIAHTATTTSFKDASYNTGNPSQGAGQEVVYSVVAVDANDIESPAHELTMPAITVTLEKAQPIVMSRGVFNQLLFRVDNKGVNAASRLRLSVAIAVNNQNKQHISDYFDVAAGANTLVPVVIGGYDKLDVLTDLNVQVEQKPLANQNVVIKQRETVEVGNSSLTVDLVTQDFTRGGTGKVAFTITNTSDVETEVVVATQNGNKDSNEIRFIVEDLQGNLLNQQAIRQTSGNVISVPSGHVVARIAPHETFTSAEFNINVPAAAPDLVKLRLVIDKYHYHQGKADHVEIAGVGVSKDVQLADTPYYAEVTSVSPQLVSARNGTVTVTGVVKERSSGQPQANAPINIVYTVRGFERNTTAYTNAAGQFTTQYTLDGTAGKYRVSAIHPDMTDRPGHGEFVAQGASITPTDLDLKIPRNYTHKIPVRIVAGDESQLNNLRIVQMPNGTDTEAQLPLGITVTHEPLATINANTAKTLNVHFSGDNTAAEKGILSYRVEADGHTGVNALGIVNISYTLSEAAPAVATKPTYVDTGVGLEQQIQEDVVITNKGLEVLRNAQVELLGKNSSTIPAWVSLTTASALGDIPVGDSRLAQIIAKPAINTPEGIYELRLQIKGDNLAAYTLPVFIKVTQSGKGNAFFKITDIYTATKDSNNQLIEGLSGARIQLQNENVLSEVFNLNTDADGEAIFEGIPAGRYAYRVSAFDHASVSGRIWVKPDVTSNEKVFLMNNLVNVEWSVREITIEDRYEIKLEATFKTFVPVALLMLEPLHVNLPVMKKGEVFQGEFTLTNYGLIRADNVKQSFPQDTQLVRFEFLRQVPTSLDSGIVFTMPYRIHALRDFNPSSDADATGGGCGSMSASTSVSYNSICPEGTSVGGGAGAGWSSNWGSCGGSGAPHAVSVTQSYGSGGSGGGWSGSGTWVSDGPNYCEAAPACDDDCNKDNASAQ